MRSDVNAWMDRYPPALREALLQHAPPESDPRIIVGGGQAHIVHAPRVDLRSAGWRAWLLSDAGQAWLRTRWGRRWVRGRGAKWAEREAA